MDALFDRWDPAPLSRRALDNDARGRIVEEWVEHRREGDVRALVVPLDTRVRWDVPAVT